MNHLTRRTFLKSSAFAAAGVALSARSWGQVAGANGEIRVAVLGLNGRGKSHIKNLLAAKGARLVALCDPDSAVLAKRKGELAAEGVAVKTYADMREVFASPDIDAVTIATPNHWHALAGIWALQAGKDVYVEKPISHNIWEGNQLVAAAAKHRNRIVQAGTQIRSGEGLREAVAWVQAGNLGKITASRGFCFKYRPSIGKMGGPVAVPASINYDLWTGPAPLIPPHRNFPKNGPVHYDWHWIYAYGNGDVGNQGIHQMDVARWFLGEAGLPRQTMSVGGRLGYVDDGETPNTQVVVHDYATAPLIFEVRGLPRAADVKATTLTGASPKDSGMDGYRDTEVSVGNVVECEGGSVVTTEYFTATAYDKKGKVVKQFKGKDRHMQNFIDVIHSRKTADLYGPIEQGNISSALCHLGNLSHQIGKATNPGELRERVKGDAGLADACGRMVEHLGANKIDVKELTLGVALALNAKSAKFTGEFSKAANHLLSREYRPGFVVPKIA
ncbi:MAG: Gfo/Idh/MocA family oxidoreductase [Opitutus sp.]|nr:Gfo/Idh/MocA family oxidoreductase [Opitutus sp.]